MQMILRTLFHSAIFIFLTAVSQIGGIAWVLALFFKRRVLVFASAYVALSVSALWIAPMFGRVPLPCVSGDALQMQSKMYCALNRQYVVPELKDVLTDYAADMEAAFPGTRTRVLDGNFPYLAGFPLLPHLSHNDGRKVDLAFYYQNEEGYLPAVTRSPIGYFAFEDGPTACPDVGLTLRWNMAWLQNLWPDYTPEPDRMKKRLELLTADSRVGKVFIEPHLTQSYGVTSDKIRFQGCRAARHDDHIHFQL